MNALRVYLSGFECEKYSVRHFRSPVTSIPKRNIQPCISFLLTHEKIKRRRIHEVQKTSSPAVNWIFSYVTAVRVIVVPFRRFAPSVGLGPGISPARPVALRATRQIGSEGRVEHVSVGAAGKLFLAELTAHSVKTNVADWNEI